MSGRRVRALKAGYVSDNGARAWQLYKRRVKRAYVRGTR